MQVKPGDRVRCVDATFSCERLHEGKTYTVTDVRNGSHLRLFGVHHWWTWMRFKPVVRIKMGRREC